MHIARRGGVGGQFDLGRVETRPGQRQRGRDIGVLGVFGGRLARRLTSDLALVGGGVFLAVNMIADPAFTLLAVTVREAPVLWWIPAWVVWAVLSQSLMLVLWVVTLVDREGRLVDRTARAVRAGIARSGGLVRLGLLALGVLALWDGSGRIGA